jgi:hypothetical protein
LSPLVRTSPEAVLFVVGWLTFAIEFVTVVLRFGFFLESNVHTCWLARFTRGLRVHHSYVGVLLLAASPLLGPASIGGTALFLAGAALALSDLMHHFLVLWPITGSPEFHVWYPGPAAAVGD